MLLALFFEKHRRVDDSSLVKSIKEYHPFDICIVAQSSLDTIDLDEDEDTDVEEYSDNGVDNIWAQLTQ